MGNANLVWGVIGIAAFVAIPLLCLWFIIDGLRKGVVRVKIGSYSRADDPAWYWACIALYAALITWFLYLAARVALDP